MRKIAGIIATLFVSGAVILLASFLLLKLKPGDPVLSLPGMSGNAASSLSVRDQRYEELYAQYGFNLPVFYFTLGNMAVPDSFNYVANPVVRSFLINLSRETGRPDIIALINAQLLNCSEEAKLMSPDYQWIISREIMNLMKVETWDQFSSSYNKVIEIWKSENVPHLKSTDLISANLRIVKSGWKQWIPTMSFHGNNQFHTWCKGWLKGSDSGIVKIYRTSHLNGLPVYSVIKKPFIITMIISILSMLLSVIIAIPAACELVIRRDNKWIERLNNALLFLYSVPVFWVAVLFLIFFASPMFLNVFPSSGIEPVEGFPDDIGIFMRAFIGIGYFVLPVIALSYGAIIFFIRLLRNGLLSELQQDYVVTARASGYTERSIVYRFALKNAFYSSLTLMWITFPALLSGSVLIENVFSIPGMGSLLIRSVQNQDHPVLISIFMLIGIITSLSFVLLDIVQSYFDPRLKIEKGGMYE
jgi:peptide/nickel transport system permease protein